MISCYWPITSFLFMMMSSNGNIFGVTGPLCGEFTAHWWITPQTGQWHEALVFSLICALTIGCSNNRDIGDLRRHHAQYDVTVMLAPNPYKWIKNSFLWDMFIFRQTSTWFRYPRDLPLNTSIRGFMLIELLDSTVEKHIVSCLFELRDLATRLYINQQWCHRSIIFLCFRFQTTIYINFNCLWTRKLI